MLGQITGASAPPPDAAALAPALERLGQTDPAFDANAFTQRVGKAFEKIQAAWCAQNCQTIRAFISDGVYERFALQFAEQHDLGYRDHMEKIGIDDMAIVEVVSRGLFDELSVRIAAQAVDYRVTLAEGKFIVGSTMREPFVEVWSFLRRRGTKTNAARTGLMEGNCPNCGAPIEMNQSANCQNCKALLRSGEYDWVLCEITQESEWERYRVSEPPGMAEMAQRDPEFNVYALEDRTSVMFWRKAAADRLGRIEPLTKIALPAFCQTYAPGLRAGADGQRTFLGECGVGAVALQGVQNQNDGDRVIVEVRWSGKRFLVQAGRFQNTHQDVLMKTLFVLFRGAGVRTKASQSISSAHCPQCGAPESGGISAACEFCGAVLNDGSLDWVLENMLAVSDPQAQALLRELNPSTRLRP
jgi:hypothetical protein